MGTNISFLGIIPQLGGQPDVKVHVCPFLFFFGGIKALQDKAMQRHPSTNQRDAPGCLAPKDTGRSQGHLSSYLLGGAPGERHRARCKTDSRGCDTHCRGLDERPTQNLRSTGQETHRATVGCPGQTWNTTMTRNQPKRDPTERNRGTHTTVCLAVTEAGQQTCGPMKKGKVFHRSRTRRNKDGRRAAKQG
jgi:hypothetical protein